MNAIEMAHIYFNVFDVIWIQVKSKLEYSSKKKHYSWRNFSSLQATMCLANVSHAVNQSDNKYMVRGFFTCAPFTRGHFLSVF